MGETIEILSIPLMVVRCTGNDGRGVSYSSTQHNVSTVSKCFDNAPCSKIALGVDRLKLPVCKLLACLISVVCGKIILGSILTGCEIGELFA